jgi:hypothetical protein
MYQPEVESWAGEELRAHAALAVEEPADKTTKYGVIWFSTRTEVDKVGLLPRKKH